MPYKMVEKEEEKKKGAQEGVQDVSRSAERGILGFCFFFTVGHDRQVVE